MLQKEAFTTIGTKIFTKGRKSFKENRQKFQQNAKVENFSNKTERNSV